MEPYPIISLNGCLTGLLSSSTEFTEVSWVSGGRRVYMWLDKHTGVDVTSYVFGDVLRVRDAQVDLKKWLEKMPVVLGYTLEGLESYVKLLAEAVRDKLGGKRVVLSYSGGKDSSAALVILDKLMEYLSFKLHVVYVHMPFLEPLDNVKFVESVSRKLGLDIEVLSPPKKLVAEKLLEEGLPYRRARWCTYLKVRKVREARKSLRADFEAYGDRLIEAKKRLRRLIKPALSKAFLSGKKFRPTFMLTLLDVVELCKQYGLVHPDYLKGLPRVSCSLCPYKALHEFSITPGVEDPGFIEEVLRRSYAKWYEGKVDYDKFLEQELWRYTPTVAKMFCRAKEKLKEVEGEVVEAAKIHELYSSIWRGAPRGIPKLSLEDVIQVAKASVVS